MVIDKSGKPKQVEVPPLEERKAQILGELGKLTHSELLLAYMYAKGYSLGGINITKEMSNAVQNYQALEMAYRKGYEDALKDLQNNQTRDFFHKVLVNRKEKK